MAAFDGSSSSSQAEKSKNALKAYVKQALTTNNTQQDYYPRYYTVVEGPCAIMCMSSRPVNGNPVCFPTQAAPNSAIAKEQQ